ncbi:hypothetical protein B0H13DRAFT_889848 [Mycena leptocephala]|nr:hypothetical protein B0H13DRAFT_889848 [Mycena leptocephala]
MSRQSSSPSPSSFIFLTTTHLQLRPLCRRSLGSYSFIRRSWPNPSSHPLLGPISPFLRRHQRAVLLPPSISLYSWVLSSLLGPSNKKFPYNHLKLQCMCDGPPSCTNGCPATMPAAAGCRIGSSISADHRNMHYSRSVQRPSHKVLCDSTTTQFLHPMTPLLLCVVDGCRVWLDRRVRRIRPI